LCSATHGPLAADFEVFVNEVLKNRRFDAAAIERWRRFVAGEDMSRPPAETTATPA
jgi:hypothetical protein